MQQIDLLILGAGWTSTFLLPLLKKTTLTHAETSTTGHSNTTKFKYDPSITDSSYFSILPSARIVLVTFPLRGAEQTQQLVKFYKETHPRAEDVGFIQLGSTGIWQAGGQTVSGEDNTIWKTRHSAFDKSNARAQAEDALLELGGCVLNLAGLWGGQRQPRQWVDRVATTKEAVEGKMSLHMIHGMDVARGIIAVVKGWGKHTRGQRWMLTDGFVYDWWALFAGWASAGDAKEDGSDDSEPSKQSVWVYELMRERDVRALPRSLEMLGRCYDSREFWRTFGITPLKARI